ncbi:MAG: hypothetical protein MUO30_02785 [Anaerolineales bacterium]|nr:hypothetical protein [Anaerolineales bacterium]
MPKNPLAEVFGFPVSAMSEIAVNHRNNRLCPFHNSSGPNCTKASVDNPLGVCSIYQGNSIVVTCPVRFRQDFKILSDAGRFFFGDKKFVALTEVRLNDKAGKSAGNMDIVLAVLDSNGKVLDFGTIEVQAVYISGNVRKVFDAYISDPNTNYMMEWPAKNYPKPDYLSSSRKRLAPQLIYKGGILHQWEKKMAVVVHRGFFEELPDLEIVNQERAEIVWLVYDLNPDDKTGSFNLHLSQARYTMFDVALERIITPDTGDVNIFTRTLETRIKNGKLFGNPPSILVEPTVEPIEYDR